MKLHTHTHLHLIREQRKRRTRAIEIAEEIDGIHWIAAVKLSSGFTVIWWVCDDSRRVIVRLMSIYAGYYRRLFNHITENGNIRENQFIWRCLTLVKRDHTKITRARSSFGCSVCFRGVSCFHILYIYNIYKKVSEWVCERMRFVCNNCFVNFAGIILICITYNFSSLNDPQSKYYGLKSRTVSKKTK